MATVSPQAPSVPGTTPTYSSASGGGDLLNITPNGNTLIVKTSGTPTTITLVTPGTVLGLAIADNAVTLGSTAEMWIDINYAAFASSAGQCAISWSSTTGVTFALVSR